MSSDVWDTRLDTSETWTMSTLGPVSMEWTEEHPIGEVSTPIASLPERWQKEEPELPVVHLRGVGLGLFMLRTRRFVGRERERDRLWQCLSKVVVAKHAEAVIVRGPTGVGKSRRTQWLAQRAHEVGCTELPLVVHADPDHDTQDGLLGAIREALGIAEADPSLMERRLFRRLIRAGELDTERAAVCLRALSGGAEASETAREHRAALAWLVGVLARQRPLVLCLEDVQWSSTLLRFMQAVLDDQGRAPAPILLLATVRTDALIKDPKHDRLLDGLGRRAGVSTLEIDGMPAAELVSLVRDTYGIDGTLAQRLAARAHGSPLYATQLIGSWARAGLLDRGPGGFTVGDSADDALPETLAGLWDARLKGVSADDSEERLAAAEVAAFLGTAFQLGQWRAVVDAAGFANAGTTMEVLLSQGLLLPMDEGHGRLVFVHGLMREALVRRSRVDGRAAWLNGVIADVLARDPGVDDSARIGGHLLEAGRYLAALEPLFEGARRQKHFGQYGLADDIVVDYLRALQGAEVPPGDDRWIEAWIQRAQFMRMNGDAEASLKWALKAEAAAGHPDQAGLRAKAARAVGNALSRLGRLDEAHAALERGLRLARDLSAHQIELWCHTSFSYLLPRMGRFEEAEVQARKALALHQAGYGDATSLGNVWGSLGHILSSLGKLEEAAEALEKALSAYREAGNRSGMATMANDQGDLLRAQGRLAEAEASYKVSIATYAALGAMQQHIAELNLGFLSLEQGRWRTAHSLLQRCAREFRAHGWTYVEAAAEVGLAACAIVEGDGGLWDLHIARAGELWATTGVDVSFARLSEQVATLAEEHDPSRACGAWALAADQWDGLGRQEEASAARLRADR